MIEDPGDKRKNLLITVVLILVVIILGYYLCRMVGGQGFPGGSSGGVDILSPLAELGKGIGRMFRNLLH